MNSIAKKPWMRRLLLGLGVIASLGVFAAIVGVIYISLIDREISERLTQLSSTRSSSFYAPYPDFTPGQVFAKKELDSLLKEVGYRNTRGEVRNPGEFSWQADFGANYLQSLTLYRPTFETPGQNLDRLRAALLFERTPAGYKLQEILDLSNNENLSKFEHPPKRMGFFFAGRVRTQSSVPLSEMPVNLRLAVIAIEDNQFLEHHGVSARSTLRALVKDIIEMRAAQGGSTITQQLMKNLFFSHEKLLSRKIKEAIYSFVAEARHEKEKILEAYLNEIYLGQWNTHEIHGMAEAARYYFNRSIFDLTLSQCAILAGIIQRPNYFNPHRHPDRTRKRRNIVLRRMRELNFILENQYQQARAEPIDVAPASKSLDDAAYFMDYAMKALPPRLLDRLDDDALTVHLTLNPYLQASASRSLKTHIERMESYYKTLKDNKEAGKDLQGAIIAIDVPNCNVIALQGGRSFQKTPFNRVIQGKRQPGSLFKPFVYLTALGNRDLKPRITPISQVEDEEFTWEYEGQSWTPRNYDEEFRGPLSVREALENSRNVPTAKIARMTGVSGIIENIRKSGIISDIPKVPSISLGSAEVTPFELANAYSTFARLGDYCTPRAVSRVFDENGNLIYTEKQKEEPALDPVSTFLTVQLMKGVIQRGTGTLAKKSGLPVDNFAGKTGTTNDFKDAWFVGYSPEILALVWVGYDVTENVGLPGAVAALPIWIDFMKRYSPFLGEKDFEQPSGLVRVKIDRQTRGLATNRCPTPEVEYFARGTEPPGLCTRHR